jgi:hypothetical protein
LAFAGVLDEVVGDPTTLKPRRMTIQITRPNTPPSPSRACCFISSCVLNAPWGWPRPTPALAVGRAGSGFGILLFVVTLGFYGWYWGVLIRSPKHSPRRGRRAHRRLQADVAAARASGTQPTAAIATITSGP